MVQTRGDESGNYAVAVGMKGDDCLRQMIKIQRHSGRTGRMSQCNVINQSGEHRI